MPKRVRYNTHIADSSRVKMHKLARRMGVNCGTVLDMAIDRMYQDERLLSAEGKLLAVRLEVAWPDVIFAWPLELINSVDHDESAERYTDIMSDAIKGIVGDDVDVEVIVYRDRADVKGKGLHFHTAHDYAGQSWGELNDVPWEMYDLALSVQEIIWQVYHAAKWVAMK